MVKEVGREGGYGIKMSNKGMYIIFLKRELLKIDCCILSDHHANLYFWECMVWGG